MMQDWTVNSDESLSSSLVDSLKPNQLVHLHNVLRDELHSLENYYGENADSFSNPDAYADLLARKYADAVEEFLYRDANHFTYSKRNQTALDDLLIDQGISSEFLEEINPTYTEYLLFIYHEFFDPEQEILPGYEGIAAKTLLFQDHRGKVFHHQQNLYIDQDHLKRKCERAISAISESGRNFHIEPLLIEDDKEESEVVLKFYWERTRNPEMIFKDRLPDDHSNSGNTGITHRPAYPIKTITVKIENTDEQCKISLSKSKSGWESKLETFFAIVYKIPDPFNTFQPKRDAAVDGLIDTVQQAAGSPEDEHEDNDTVFDAAKQEIDELREETVDEIREENGNEVAKTLDEGYRSIKPTGIMIRDDENTLSAEFSVKSKATLKEWEAKNEGASTIIAHELNNADKDKIGIRFRGYLRDEETPDEFILMDGTWISDGGGGVSQETTESLNRLLGDFDE